MKECVVVAMSGGVDSSVAAALLQKEGYEVIGISICFFPSGRPISKGIEDARRVCHKLGIKHYIVNMQKELEKYVIKDFCQEYLKGRTPNPCVRCNQYIKFSVLLKKAFSLDAEFLATGHYARIIRTKEGYLLKKAKDLNKDQSYFLYRLGQEQLKHILFPLGDYTKSQVRQLAGEFKLSVADKPASQEICFLAAGDYRGFLKHRLKNTDYVDLGPGPIIDKQANILGEHKGIGFYTIGQREGLGIAKGYPLYITKIDTKNNRIIVGKKEDAEKRDFLIKDSHFILKQIKKKIVARIRIRYNHKEALAEIVPNKDKIKISFRKPQFAITPGQSAVFYDRDNVLGGGIIDKILN